jgi:adenine-specific DNA-methyltransferase
MNELPEKLDLTSLDIAAGQREKLRQLFPEAITEGGKVDFDRLKATLGEVVDTGKERYGMNWPGKSECFRTIQAPSRATLRPCRKESVNFDTAENLIIEGDNLEALKLLQKGYLGKVKMIYIDPPYNTGNEFIYPDNYSESLDTYLTYTGQVDAGGRKFSTNTETDGRFHSKWMNMMYPRLFLARNLLREDGVIFISIDDHEVDNLRKLCNEIFGEENFLGELVWHSKKGGGGDVKTIVTEHEYILAYAKYDPESSVGKLSVEAQPLNLFDERGNYRKGRELNKWGAGSARADRPTMFFPIPGPNGEEVYPIRNDGSEGRWRLGKPAMSKIVADGNALFECRTDGSFIVYEKIRSTDPRRKSYRTLLTNAGTAAEGTATIKDLFDGKSPFDFPKPVGLLRKLMDIGGVQEDDTVLDFFGGSGTTAQAVLEANRETESDLRFILVQLPEVTSSGEFVSVADITKERVRRVIQKMAHEATKTTKEEKDTNPLNLDLRDSVPSCEKSPPPGFKVFKLDTSNFKTWDGVRPESPEAVVQQLELHVDHVLAGRTQEDILTELLLKSGFPLSTQVERMEFARESAKGAKFYYSVEEGAMLICLEKDLTAQMVKELAEKKPSRVICLDAGFQGSDQLKTNAVQTMKARGVLKFQTV